MTRLFARKNRGFTLIELMIVVAIIGILWQYVYTPNIGLLNGTLRAVGLDGLSRSWATDAQTVEGAVVLTGRVSGLELGG